jgi:hypothetical protein
MSCIGLESAVSVADIDAVDFAMAVSEFSLMAMEKERILVELSCRE